MAEGRRGLWGARIQTPIQSSDPGELLSLLRNQLEHKCRRQCLGRGSGPGFAAQAGASQESVMPAAETTTTWTHTRGLGKPTEAGELEGGARSRRREHRPSQFSGAPPCSPLAMTPGPHLSRETHPSISVSPNKRPLGRGHGRGHGTPLGSLTRSSEKVCADRTPDAPAVFAFPAAV